MATKLKNLKIRKVDFVEEGANPDADIKIKKRREEGTAGEVGSRERGNLLKKLFGFIGKAAGMDQEEIDSAVDEIQKDASVSFNEKIKEVNYRKIMDEIWETCYALQSSFCSIINDEEMDSTSAEAAMKESLGEFDALVQGAISSWVNGKTINIIRKKNEVSEEELEVMKSAVKRLKKAMEESGNNVALDDLDEDFRENRSGKEDQKGEGEEMKIDKSKLTPAERAFLESIEKRYGMGEEMGTVGEESTVGAIGQILAPGTIPTNQLAASATAAPVVTKSAPQTVAETPALQTNPQEDIYKGLHPAVVTELEELRKFREEAEDRELAGIAKKYAIIGKKEEELVPTLKSLKAAGGTAYQDMIAVLDQAVIAVEKSGIFSEIGKSVHGSIANGAWAEAEAKASELMKSKMGLSKAQALDAVFMENPELAARCEKEE